MPIRIVFGLVTVLLFATATLTAARAADAQITIVAAENFYGDVAQQIGGDLVSVVNILSNPDQDPHLFETAPSVVREIAA
ncbi:MAG TPA: zinc ABC transporter substrate-binding protein, partial [Xanthobacteraceae bacterium]|nr:zinc ABC transporter substrate-binding protein [Xanthobacteraceae bacterium]